MNRSQPIRNGTRISASADVAASIQITVCNIGSAAGSLADGLTLQNAGNGAVAWATSCSPPPPPQ
jgi:predicted MFS family arabinose efflux permease